MGRSKTDMETVLLLLVIVEITPATVVPSSTATHGELRTVGVEQQNEHDTDRDEDRLAVLRMNILVAQRFLHFRSAMGQQIFDRRILELRHLAIGKDLVDVGVPSVKSYEALPIVAVA